MLTKKQIAAIHVAKSRAGLSQDAYKALLREVAGVDSSTDPELTNRDCDAILKALTVRRDGWQDGQIKMLHKYQRFAGMTSQEARELLFKVTGITHEESPALKQDQFETVMAELETRLENRIGRGEVQAPADIEIGYWRSRLPGAVISTRQVYEIERLWSQLLGYLPEEKRRTAYLLALIGQACRMKYPPHAVDKLTSWRGIKAIEALKARLDQEERKIKDEIPF